MKKKIDQIKLINVNIIYALLILYDSLMICSKTTVYGIPKKFYPILIVFPRLIASKSNLYFFKRKKSMIVSIT